MSEVLTLKVDAVDEERLPEVIKTEVAGLAEYKKKKEGAKEKRRGQGKS